MNISTYQIILGLVSLLFIANGAAKFLRKESGQTILKLALTLAVWASIFAFAIFPHLSHMLSIKLGLGENFNTLIFTGFVIVFAILFKIITLIERTEKNISEIVRKEALNKLEK